MVTSAAPEIPDAPDPENTWAPTHYQRAILAGCERRAVSTAKAVFTNTGIKLVEGGVRLNQDMYWRLARHDLRAPLEELLTIEDLVSTSSLVELAREQCQHEPLLHLLAQDGRNAIPTSALVAPLQAMSLPRPLAFMLSVMREQFPEQYTHAMHVALVAIYLGARANWSKGECTSLAAAGLLHDIGTLHIDPVWLDSTRKRTGPEREQLAKHPIIAAQLVNACEVYPRSVAVAILEHHERMDGSGYPRGTRATQISPLGQVLLLAEVVAAFFEKYANDGAAVRLSLTLRLGHHKFPADLAQLLLPILPANNIQTGNANDLQQVQHISAQIERALAHWSQLQPEPQAPPDAQGDSGQASVFITQRIQALQRSLFDAGCHPEQQGELIPLLQDDTQGLKEMLFLVREAMWQLQSIANTVTTRWPRIASSSDASDIAVCQWRDALVAPDGD